MVKLAVTASLPDRPQACGFIRRGLIYTWNANGSQSPAKTVVGAFGSKSNSHRFFRCRDLLVGLFGAGDRRATPFGLATWPSVAFTVLRAPALRSAAGLLRRVRF